MNEPTLRDMARAAGWLQDNLGTRVPDAAMVESLSWLIAKSREDDKAEIARLKLRILAIDTEDTRDTIIAVTGLQAELSKPLDAIPKQGGVDVDAG